jgi:hypothetical protein
MTSVIHYDKRWFKYDRDKLWLVYTQLVPVIFEPPCMIKSVSLLIEKGPSVFVKVVETLRSGKIDFSRWQIYFSNTIIITTFM